MHEHKPDTHDTGTPRILTIFYENLRYYIHKVYVDDSILVRKIVKSILKLKATLFERFEMYDLS